MQLTPDQRRAVEQLKTGRSYAVYGAAGTGKSVVRDRIASLVPHAMIGPTGMSMVGSGGMTVARFLRAKPATMRSPGVLAKGMTRIPMVEGFTIIIDEAPMVATTDIFALDQGLRDMRRSQLPFGGVRIIIFGDFCQLAGPSTLRPLFTLLPYVRLNPPVIVLKTQMRQSAEEEELARLLSDCRKAFCSTETSILLLRLHRPAPDSAVRLVATRKEAHNYNLMRLERLPGELVRGLKEGAKVMVTRNIYKGRRLELVNGDTGTVEKITDNCAIVNVRNTVHRITMPWPLVPAYALTVHKAQGQTYDEVVVVGTKFFAPGQLYCAMSRVTSLSGLYCVDVIPEHFEKEQPVEVRDFLKKHSLW